MRRTLIIGLGSTGRDICDDILRRIVWSSGNNSLDQVPWVDLLVLETELKAGIPSTQYHKFVSLVPRTDEIRSMVHQPAMYDGSLDLSRWMDHSLLGGLPSLAMGAGGMRMAGRLAFFAPSVFNEIKSRLVGALQGLMAVDKARVDKALPHLHGNFTLEDKLQVFLVGTLCGGTASGCFLDAAYLTQRIADDLGYDIVVNGYFTLPPISDTSLMRRANTFAALQEWNHFLTLGTTYRVRYPDGNGKDFTSEEMPFDRSNLLQTSPSLDYATLKARTGDYLYSLAASLDFSTIFGKTVDGAVFMNGVDREGATRRWATLGISTLEFPAERLAEGCSLKLVLDTLDRMLAPAPAAAAESALTRAHLSAGDLRKALGIENLKNEIADRIDTQSEALPRQINEALALTRPPDNGVGLCGLPNGYVVTKLGGKIIDLRQQLPALLGEERAFLAPGVSIPTLSARLDALRGEIRAEIEKIERTSQQDGRTRGEVNTGTARAAAEQAIASPSAAEKKGCLGFFRRGPAPSAGAGLAPGGQALKGLVNAAIDEHFDDVARVEVYRAALDLIQLWQGRLNGLPDRPGIRQHLDETRDNVSGRLRQVRADLTSTEAGMIALADIDDEYEYLLQQTARNTTTIAEVERDWQADIIACLNVIPIELLRFKGESSYDAVADGDKLRVRGAETADRLVVCAQSRFSSVLDRPIMDRLNDPASALRWLGLVREMLDFDKYHPSLPPEQPNQSISFLFYDPAALANSTAGQSALFQTALGQLQASSPGLTVVDGVDMHRISLVKDYSGFSINAVRGCGPGGQYRKAYEEMQGQVGQKRYSRRDVSWTPISLEEMREYHRCCQMFLVGIASGLIETKGNGRYEFHYKTNSPVTLIFDDRQWADNGARLYEDKVAKMQLVMKIEGWAQEDGAAAVVEAMRRYSQDVLPVTGLKDGQSDLSEMVFRQAAFQFWHRFRDVEAEFLRRDPSSDPARMYFRLSGSPISADKAAARDGLYCLSCGNYLGEDNRDYVLNNRCFSCDDELLSNVRVL